ncbi:MAG: glycosyltransferase family 2 protein [Gemmatimonadaceae bacterium]
MNAAPPLSIGLPVYNGENYLAGSLDTLLGQTYADFELIISDNASTDGTAEICRCYSRQDSRISYIRQPRNIGGAPNSTFVFRQSRGQLFKWASHDDLYAPDLLQRCIDALDARPDVVLAHAWAAAVDSTGRVTRAPEYPLATDSLSVPERCRSLLFGDGGDDWYGVIRADILRRVSSQASYYHSDRTFVFEIGLHGPFHQTQDWLYFRREHSGQASRAPTVRAWCTNLDPGRRDRLRHPTARLFAEYVWGYVSAIRRAPLSRADRRKCYCHLAQWLANRATRGLLPGSVGESVAQPSGAVGNRFQSVSSRRQWEETS